MIPIIVISAILSVIFVSLFIYLSYQTPVIYRSKVPYHELDRYLRMSKEKQRKYLINKYLKGVSVPDGYIIAFKGFTSNMTCRNNFKYREGETYTIEGDPITCSVGFHACLIPRDVARYYYLESCKFHIVFLKDVDPFYTGIDSKKCAKTIKIGPRISSDYIIKTLN